MKETHKHIFVSIFLFFLILPGFITTHNLKSSPCNDGPNTAEYIIDQQQLWASSEASIHRNSWYAQSFIPSMTPLTKVDIHIKKTIDIIYPLEISIRKDLSGTELTTMSIPGSNVPYWTHWVECDFPDIEVTVGETYYLLVKTGSPSGQSFRWLQTINSSEGAYPRGKLWRSNNNGDTWESFDDTNFYVDATFRTYSYVSHVDLICEGRFNWTDVKPGEIKTGSFTVTNGGTPLSHLDWKILHWPSWGVWTFTPSSGDDLRPEDGPLTVQVTMEAPHSGVPDQYDGQIIIINKENEDDAEIIQASLVTPKHGKTMEWTFLGFLNHFSSYDLPFQKILTSLLRAKFN
jgi:hypothetical protein